MRQSKAKLARKANVYGAGDPQLYETPSEAVRALLASDPWFNARRFLWDPCCGPGAIVKALQEGGHTVKASDLYTYVDRLVCAGDFRFGPNFDFLEFQPAHFDVYGVAGDFDAIVMNPPYNAGRGQVSLSARFVEKALALVPRVYALLPVTFPFAGGEKGCPLRDQLFDTPRFTGEIKIRERVTMHRDGYVGKKVEQGFLNFCWFRWSAEAEPFLTTRATLKHGGARL